MAKFTEADVKELAARMHLSPKGVAFLTGAGCSITAGIPSASELVKQINRDFKESVDLLLEPSKRDDYGSCMGILSLAERERLIKPYLDAAKINWAHIALASLMKKKVVSRVLTFNFDSVLAHACGLLGIYPATYDFGIAPSDRIDYLASPCIVHLHGQGHGPTMLNTNDDTFDHSEILSPLLSDTLNNYPLIVVGYSGLADKVFDKLCALHKGRNQLYWLDRSADPKDHLKPLFEGKYKNQAHYIGGIDADKFLIDLAQRLNCFPPAVLADPAGHLLDELNDVTEFPMNDNLKDILKDTRERLDEYRDALKFTVVQNAVLQNKPADIKADDNNTDPDIAAWALIEQGNKHVDAAKSNNSIPDYKKAAKLFETARNIKPSSHEAFNNWGLVLNNLAKLQNEPELFKASFTKYQAALDINPNKHETLSNWGNALSDLAKLQNDPELFKASFAKYEAAINIKPDSYLALNNWGSALLAAWWIFKDDAYLIQANDVISRSEKLYPNDCYNGACLAAIKNNEAGCKERFFRAKAAKTLPGRQHLEEDPDLTNMRDKPWFAELLKDL